MQPDQRFPPSRCGQLPSSTACRGAWCAICCCRGRSKGRSLPQTHRESGGSTGFPRTGPQRNTQARPSRACTCVPAGRAALICEEPANLDSLPPPVRRPALRRTRGRPRNHLPWRYGGDLQRWPSPQVQKQPPARQRGRHGRAVNRLRPTPAPSQLVSWGLQPFAASTRSTLARCTPRHRTSRLQPNADALR
jgi:hypothetical protein